MPISESAFATKADITAVLIHVRFWGSLFFCSSARGHHINSIKRRRFTVLRVRMTRNRRLGISSRESTLNLYGCDLSPCTTFSGVGL